MKVASALTELDDPKVLEYAANPANEGLIIEGNEEYESLESSQNELVCYISSNHVNTIDSTRLMEVLAPCNDEPFEEDLTEARLNKYYYNYPASTRA